MLLLEFIVDLMSFYIRRFIFLFLLIHCIYLRDSGIAFFLNIIHCGFAKKIPFIDMKKIKAILKHLPSSVFNNTPISKMHDELPIMLFSVHSLLKLIESRDYVAFSYWFPIACCLIAFENTSLSKECREYILQVSFWFLFHYQSQFDIKLLQKKLI